MLILDAYEGPEYNRLCIEILNPLDETGTLLPAVRYDMNPILDVFQYPSNEYLQDIAETIGSYYSL